MSKHKNDPRRGHAEGRTEAHVYEQAPTSVVDLHYDDQCALCTDLAHQMADSVRIDTAGVRLRIDCHHQAPKIVAPGDCHLCDQAVAEDPVARALQSWCGTSLLECDHGGEGAK
ncbi:hypothetical protein IDM40_16015 [Nocardiopsis sp. HNM0947]|uniref:Uncharacterized protein n=1 Tax=Nocardiopsis coralli TaxID=2772213 RepID=A0ABR9P8M9_9ACTN|nr:hypothetical protein [Nocardiopsis coralli]MBE3000195.1 hypothetical protein [Nocardiopsis coralli]